MSGANRGKQPQLHCDFCSKRIEKDDEYVSHRGKNYHNSEEKPCVQKLLKRRAAGA